MKKEVYAVKNGRVSKGSLQNMGRMPRPSKEL